MSKIRTGICIFGSVTFLLPSRATTISASFGRGEKLIFEPYSLEMFEDAMQFARAWGLHEHVRESNYDRLVAPLST